MAKIRIGNGDHGGKFIRWADVPVGTGVSVVFKGMRRERYGPVGDLGTSDGPITVAAPTMLERLLGEVIVGDRIEIINVGMGTSEKSGAPEALGLEHEDGDQDDQGEGVA